MFPKNQDLSLQSRQVQSQEPDTVETVVGPSVHVEGDFASEGNILVKGTVSGNVTTSRLLTVEDGAKIFANVKAGDAVISGHIKGNIKVSDRLELTESAQVLGDITCKVLVVSPGALIQGKLNMAGISIEGASSEKKRSVRSRLKSTASMEEDDSQQTVE
ncbi:polymer-forming cytoskeletal protein [Candidatus Nomurabacteria bacterium]|nr:polymer-forming cytoskeletal protein [Candidatus Nomurabacteria bacterium]